MIRLGLLLSLFAFTAATQTASPTLAIEYPTSVPSSTVGGLLACNASSNGYVCLGTNALLPALGASVTGGGAGGGQVWLGEYIPRVPSADSCTTPESQIPRTPYLGSPAIVDQFMSATRALIGSGVTGVIDLNFTVRAGSDSKSWALLPDAGVLISSCVSSGLSAQTSKSTLVGSKLTFAPFSSGDCTKPSTAITGSGPYTTTLSGGVARNYPIGTIVRQTYTDDGTHPAQLGHINMAYNALVPQFQLIRVS